MSKDLVSQITSNVNVGMEEVVSVFVSQYEDKLFDRKADLSKELKANKQELKDIDKRLEDSIDREQYVGSIPSLNVSTYVDNVSVSWSDQGKNVPSTIIRVVVQDDDEKSGGYGRSFIKAINIPTQSSTVSQHKTLIDEQEDLNSQLREVMGQIKSVSRKERQIRGRISEMKLKESGFEGLLGSNEMLSLIQID